MGPPAPPSPPRLSQLLPRSNAGFHRAEMSLLRREYARAKALIVREFKEDLAISGMRHLGGLQYHHRGRLSDLKQRLLAKKDKLVAAAAAARAEEDRALGHVLGGGVLNEGDEVGEIVLSPVAEEPVADSPTASTISTEVDKPGGDPTGGEQEPGGGPTGGLRAARPQGAEEDPPPPRGRPRAALELGYSSEGSGGANDRCGVAVTDLGHPTEGPGGANNRYGVAASDLGHPTEGPGGANNRYGVAASDLGHPTEGPGGPNNRCGVAASDLGPPAEGTGTGNTLPGGITIGGDNAGDLGDGVGNGGASWGGGTDLGGGQLTALLQGGHQVMGTTGPGGGPHGLGRGIPWLDKRGRVTAWLDTRLQRVLPDEPHLLTRRESKCGTTDFRCGIDPGEVSWGVVEG